MPRLEEELCQKEKEIERIVDAIQKGISSDALMKRLAMLEEQKKVVEDSIEEEKEKSPVFTKDQFCMALYNFRKIDVNTLDKCIRVYGVSERKEQPDDLPKMGQHEI